MILRLLATALLVASVQTARASDTNIGADGQPIEPILSLDRSTGEIFQINPETGELLEDPIPLDKETIAFLWADFNGDEVLNFEEFKYFVRQMAKQGNANAKRAVNLGYIGYSVGFGRADRNDDNFLTPAELRTLRGQEF